MNTASNINMDMDTDIDAYRESFAIQGSIIINTLSDLLSKVHMIEQQLLSEGIEPTAQMNPLPNEENTLDVYKTTRLVEEPPKKRRKYE